MAKKTKMGRPPIMDGAQFVGTKLPAKLVARIDRYARDDLFGSSRSEAMRYLLERALPRSGRKESKR